ncbi:MAG: hypothetical protein U0930_16285 [Pirellulales bacterium]
MIKIEWLICCCCGGCLAAEKGTDRPVNMPHNEPVDGIVVASRQAAALACDTFANSSIDSSSFVSVREQHFVD